MKKTLSVFLAVILVLSVSLTVFAGDRTYAGDETYYNKTADNTLLTKQASYDFSGNPSDFGGITVTATTAASATFPESILYYNDKYLSFVGNNGGNLYVTSSALTDKKLSNFYMTFGFKSMGVWNQSQVRFGVIDDWNYYALRFRSSSWEDTSKNQIALVKYKNNAETVVTSVNTTANIENTDFTVKLFVNGTYVTAEVTDGTNTYPLFATLDNKAGDIKLYVSSNNAGFADINIYEYTGVVCDNDKLKEVDCDFDSDMGVIEQDTTTFAANGDISLESNKLKISGKVNNGNGNSVTKAIGGYYTDFAMEFDASGFGTWTNAYICFGGTKYNNGYAVKMTGYGGGTTTTDPYYNTLTLLKNPNNKATKLSSNEFRGDTNQNKLQDANYHVAITVRNKQLQVVFTSTDKKTAVMPIIYDLTDYTGGNIFLYVYGSQSMSVDNLKIYDLSDEAMLKAFDNQKGYVNRYGFDSGNTSFALSKDTLTSPTISSFGSLSFPLDSGNDNYKTVNNLNGGEKFWSDFYCSFDYTHGRNRWGVEELRFRQTENSKYYSLHFSASTAGTLQITLQEFYYSSELGHGTSNDLSTASYIPTNLTSEKYHIELECVGDKFTVYVNGESAFTATDDTYTSGETKIVTQDSAATFDNFFLYNYAKDGDLDESNEVDILDLVLLNKNATLKNSLYADVDNNGTANEDADFIALRNIILGK